MSDENGLTLEEMATNYETMKHIHRVQHYLHRFVRDLLDRAEKHDQSKLGSPEVELFTEFTPKLASSTYGSEQYENFRREMGDALAHHYAKNRHHPEHWPKPAGPDIEQLRADIKLLSMVMVEEEDPEVEAALTRTVQRLKDGLAVKESTVNGMNLLDLVEMFCDWKAATERHNDGNIRKSIDTNQKRFGLGKQVANVLHNTVEVVE